jgi:hypothetical protein
MWLFAPANIWRSSMHILDSIWRPRRDLNPCYRRERAVSWAGLDDGDARSTSEWPPNTALSEANNLWRVCQKLLQARHRLFSVS